MVHPLKPEKVRVVYDCAAKYKQVSLNEQVLQGPDEANHLMGVLSRFRQDSVGLVANIKAMFHQVLVEPRDCDVLRFLWWPEGDLCKDLVLLSYGETLVWDKIISKCCHLLDCSTLKFTQTTNYLHTNVEYNACFSLLSLFVLSFQWTRWREDLPKLAEVKASRCFKRETFGEIKTRELYLFSDASRQGYSAVAYLRSVDASSRIHVAFVMGKARLAPLREISIPRLELTAAVVSV